MEDKLHSYFSDQNFDIHEPHLGHFERFERKLKQPKKRQFKWQWLSVAASITLIFTFWLGSYTQKQTLDLADVSPKMEEVQDYFVSTIYQELQTVEKHRSLETETIIEQALESIEELEDEYKSFVQELNNNGEQRKLINAMIKNYQRRLDILENLLIQIDQIKNPKLLNDEIFI
ncbi:MAG: hypothetical protein CMB99_12225 [Flavobacteriaceae bacterium]|nr:hypothetical protein [Flavobacteriaceae bacterium]|tara:strand:- start:109379 stop:109900 length:522 start_codon:yes stop_codon:yes gene_type:complete